MVDNEQQIDTGRFLYRVDLIIQIQAVQIGELLAGMGRVRIRFAVPQRIDPLMDLRVISGRVRIHLLADRFIFDIKCDHRTPVERKTARGRFLAVHNLSRCIRVVHRQVIEALFVPFRLLQFEDGSGIIEHGISVGIRSRIVLPGAVFDLDADCLRPGLTLLPESDHLQITDRDLIGHILFLTDITFYVVFRHMIHDKPPVRCQTREMIDSCMPGVALVQFKFLI